MNKTWYVLIITLLASFSLTMFVYSNYMVVDTISIPMLVTVGGEIVGFDVNSTALTFGTVPKNGGGTRYVTVENKYDMPIRVFVKRSGTIAPYVTVVEQTFRLRGGEMKQINFTVSAGEVEGEFSGTANIVFRRIVG